MRAVLTRWAMEDLDPDLLDDAINDAIEDLWEQVCLFQLTIFMQGPITSLTFAPANGGAAAQQRQLLVSVPDPTVAPSLSAVSGGGLILRSLDICYTLVTDSGTETNLSPPTTVTIGPDLLTSCAPPAFDTAIPAASGPYGWNVSAQVTGSGRWARQNLDPISFDDAWQEPATGIVQDPELPGPPVSNTTADDIAYIRHMEMQTPDLTYKVWNEADIDSQLMRSCAATISSASPYQSYVWDLINRQTVELRPPAGTALNPRYWYIQRPRRLRYDNSLIPYQNVIGILGYVRKAALSDILLSIHEYQASSAWEKKAGADLTRTLQSVNQTSWSSNTRVVPVIGH